MRPSLIIRFVQTDTTPSGAEDGIQFEGPDPVTINPLEPAFWDPMIDQLRSFQEAAIAFIPRLVVGLVALAIALLIAPMPRRRFGVRWRQPQPTRWS